MSNRSRALAALVVLCADPLGAAVAPSHPGVSSGSFQPAGPPAAVHGVAILNVDSGMTFPTIQAAISAAAAGDTLEVQVATHGEGQVVVDRDLTIRGASGSEVVQMTVDTGASGDARGWFRVQPGVDLQVRDLIFDGNGFLVWQAFRHQGTGLFENCTFRDIQFDPSGPSYAGTAIAAFGGVVDVRNCLFEDIGRIGVLLFGAGVSGAIVEDNTFAGKGDGDFLDYAVELGAGAVATVRRNRATDCRGVASVDGSTSAGFMITTFFGPGTEGTFESNTLLASTSGFAVGFDAADTAIVVARHNRIFGNAAGVDSTSMIAVDAENNWWGCNGGPGTAACDPTTGLVDSDPWLVLGLAALPGTVPAGGMATATADLAINSDAVDTSGTGAVQDGTPVDFSATLGAMMPAMGETVSGAASSTFTAGGLGGIATLDAGVDNETVSTPVEVLGPDPVDIPAAHGPALSLLAMLLAVGAAWRIRRTRSMR